VPDKPQREPPPSRTKKAKAKRAWEPPRLESGHLFESNSLACGKNSGATQQCQMNPETS
jgi:hypothetical protein